jgi:hypothetical protein
VGGPQQLFDNVIPAADGGRKATSPLRPPCPACDTGSYALTQNAVETQTGTLSGNQAVAGTDSHGVAGTLTNADTVANLGNVTQTSASTLTEAGGANFTLSELGGYGAGSWALGCFSLTEVAAGNFTSQRSDTLTEAGNGTVNRSGSGTDRFALTLAAAHTVTGVGSAGYADHETYHFTETATDSTTEAGPDKRHGSGQLQPVRGRQLRRLLLRLRLRQLRRLRQRQHQRQRHQQRQRQQRPVRQRHLRPAAQRRG